MLVSVSSIKVNPGRREAPKNKVRKLAESMKNVGLLNPITLDQEYTLIAGLYRLEAARFLEWTEIECTILPLDGIQAELAKIDENVIRNQLPHLDQCDALLRRKELYESLHPETKNGGNRKGYSTRTQNLRSGKAKPFVQDTAEKLGISRRTVELQVQTAKNLTPKAKEIIRQAGINIGKMDALFLSRLPPEQQAEAAHLYVSGQIHAISEYTPGGTVQRNPPAALVCPVLVEPEPENMWKPYSIPLTPQADLTTAEMVAQLKSHDKDTTAAPWMFLETMTQFAENFCQELTAYLDGSYAPVFSSLDPDQMRYLRQRLDRMITAADKFYQYIEGENHHVQQNDRQES